MTVKTLIKKEETLIKIDNMEILQIKDLEEVKSIKLNIDFIN
jgi:hypothetical protein